MQMVYMKVERNENMIRNLNQTLHVPLQRKTFPTRSNSIWDLRSKVLAMCTLAVKIAILK